MQDNIIQFIPRSNPKADRAFWISQTEAEQREAILKSEDTAPAEYNYQAPEKDPA